MMNTPGFPSIEKGRARWSSPASDGYLSAVAVGVICGIIVAFSKTAMHLPGHKALLWMAPVLAARLVSRTAAGASIGALTTSITTLSIGGRIAGSAAMFPLIIGAGALLDLAVAIAERYRLAFFQRLFLLVIAGGMANLICFSKRLMDPIASMPGGENVWEILIAAGSHLLFGLLAGFLGCGAGYWLRARRWSEIFKLR